MAGPPESGYEPPAGAATRTLTNLKRPAGTPLAAGSGRDRNIVFRNKVKTVYAEVGERENKKGYGAIS